MSKHQPLARAAAARGLAAGLLVFAFALIGLSGSSAWAGEPKDIKWGTGSIGSSGHKAMVALAGLLNKEMPEFRISVLPTQGAVPTVKGFATGEFDGYYGSDVALKELKNDVGRFKGFKSHIKHELIQSFWCYTLDVGLAINASDRDTIKKWGDLTGKTVYTGPLPFDTRKHLEDAMRAVGVDFTYKEVDFSAVASELNSGTIKGMIIYAAGGQTPPPWLSEASLAVDWAALNPSSEELATLKEKGFASEEVDPANFHKKEVYAKQVTLLPFYWGFDLGSVASTDEMYKMLTIIEAHADELAKLDPSFRQIGGGKMVEFQKKALESTWNLVPIHPGLAKFLKEKGAWDSKWDANIAKM
ncbi:MAG: TAXI family TRAP transporter solute-binding subunit [Rhodomicrobiaceae bacterium]